MTRTLLCAAAALTVPAATVAQIEPTTAMRPFVMQREGSGPPVIFIPGLTSPGWVWQRMVDALREHYTCHVVTLAGFAGVPPVESLSAERLRDELLRYIADEKLDRPVLVGHSVGGLLAYMVAVAQPETAGGIFSIEGAPFLPAIFDTAATADGMRATASNMRRAIASSSREAFTRQSTAQLVAQVGDSAARAALIPVAAASDPATTAQLLYDQYTIDLRAQLHHIRVPVELLVGTAGIAPHARAAYVANARRQHAGIAQLTVREIPTARHFVQLDDPAAVTRFLREFLERVRPVRQ